jgi:hypothetical protein
VETDLAARLPLAVLDRIGDVDIPTIDVHFFEALVEQLSRRAYEGPAFFVFLLAGLLADHHDCDFRPSGVLTRVEFAEDRLSCLTIDFATLALLHGCSEYGQRPFLGDKGSCVVNKL